jgi:hypothetical protein
METEQLTGVSFRPVRDGVGPIEESFRLEDFDASRELLRRAAACNLDRRSWEFQVWLSSAQNEELIASISKEQQTMYARLRKSVDEGGYCQLLISSQPVRIEGHTKFGHRPWDSGPEEKHLCPFGHNYGLDVLSEVFIYQPSYDGSDFVVSEKVMGASRGLFFPIPILMVSIKALDFLKEHCPNSFKFHSLVRMET